MGWLTKLLMFLVLLAQHPKLTVTKNSVTTCSGAWMTTTRAQSHSANFSRGLCNIRRRRSNTIAQRTSEIFRISHVDGFLLVGVGRKRREECAWNLICLRTGVLELFFDTS